MEQSGFHISKNGIDGQGLGKAETVHWNLRPAEIYEMALARGEGEIAGNGPLLVKTGQHTGRSAQDKFIVRDAFTEDCVWWDNNKSITYRHRCHSYRCIFWYFDWYWTDNRQYKICL